MTRTSCLILDAPVCLRDESTDAYFQPDRAQVRSVRESRLEPADDGGGISVTSGTVVFVDLTGPCLDDAGRPGDRRGVRWVQLSDASGHLAPADRWSQVGDWLVVMVQDVLDSCEAGRQGSR